MANYVLLRESWIDQLAQDLVVLRQSSGSFPQSLMQSQKMNEQQIIQTQTQNGIGLHIEAISNHMEKELHPVGMLL